MRKLKHILKASLLGLIALCSLCATAQDARFSQFFTTPHLVNPSFTSLFAGDYQVMLNYRNQWGSALENPYRTLSVAADTKIYTGFSACDYVGIGFNLLADQAGALDYGTIQGNATVSYYKALDGYGKHYLGTGVSFGLAQRRVTINPNEDFLQSGEQFVPPSFMYFDLSAGLIWSYRQSTRSNYYIGAAIFHLNSPEQSFVAASRPFTGGVSPLDMRYVVHGGGAVDIGSQIRLKPSFMYQKQGVHWSADVGGFVQLLTGHLTDEVKNAVYLGAWYQFQGAAVVSARVDYEHYYLTLSYDFTTNSLSPSTRGFGGLELSLARALFRNKRPSCPDPVSCPAF